MPMVFPDKAEIPTTQQHVAKWVATSISKAGWTAFTASHSIG